MNLQTHMIKLVFLCLYSAEQFLCHFNVITITNNSGKTEQKVQNKKQTEKAVYMF